MTKVSEYWRSRMDFALLCTWLILSVVLAILAFTNYGVDFRGYYAAARVMLAGENPYDYKLVSEVLWEVTGFMGNNPFYYPPWFAWVFLPFTALPFEIARGVWMGVNFFLWCIALIRLGGAQGWKLCGWRLYFLFAGATFSFAWITWRYEQAGVLVFAILVETILAIQAGRNTRAGIGLALLLIKPNVTLLVVIGLAWWLMRRGQGRTVLIAVLTLACLLAVSTLITPDWYEPFFNEGFGAGLTTVLDGPGRIVAYRINSTFPDWLGTFGLVRQVRYALYGVFALAVLVWLAVTVWRSGSLMRVAGAAVLASFAITPYALQYDYPPLVIPFFGSLFAFTSTGRGRWVALLLAGFVLSVIFWQQNISWAYWMVVGLLGLYFWAEKFGQNGAVNTLER